MSEHRFVSNAELAAALSVVQDRFQRDVYDRFGGRDIFERLPIAGAFRQSSEWMKKGLQYLLRADIPSIVGGTLLSSDEDPEACGYFDEAVSIGENKSRKIPEREHVAALVARILVLENQLAETKQGRQCA
jgi:hypothetical protein